VICWVFMQPAPGETSSTRTSHAAPVRSTRSIRTAWPPDGLRPWVTAISICFEKSISRGFALPPNRSHTSVQRRSPRIVRP